MTIESIKALQETHIAVWNEKDRAKRDSIITKVYADNIQMYDKDFILHGIKEVSDFIDKIHSQDAGFYFSALKPMDFTQNGVRLFWEIRSAQPPGVITGMDFFMLEDGKVLHLYVYMDLNS